MQHDLSTPLSRPAPAGPVRAPGELPELTALRFFAALMVLAYHYTQTFAPGLAHAGSLLDKGYLGVDFFFLLSGFILTHVYLDAARAGRFAYADFIRARLARVYPLHLVTMAAAIVTLVIAARLGANPQDPIDPREVVANALLVHAWGVLGHYSLNAPSWSISAEWAAYLLFPVFLTLTRAGARRPGLFLALAIAAYLAAWQGSEHAFARPLTELTFDGGALRILPAFLAGCALCTVAGRLQPEHDSARIGLAISGAGVLVLMHAGASDVIIIAVMAATILFAALCATAADGGETSWLAARPLVYLGELSFAVCMTHRILEMAVTRILAPALGWGAPAAGAMAVLAAAGTLAASAALHHFVERPARAAMRRAPPSRRAAPGATRAARARQRPR